MGQDREKAMIHRPVGICGEMASEGRTVADNACMAGTATELISFIRTSFRTDDIRADREFFPPMNPCRHRCAFPETDGIVVTVAPGSDAIRNSLPGAWPIRKTGNEAGTEGRFGKKFNGGSIDSLRGPNIFFGCADSLIGQEMGLHPAPLVPGGKDSRHLARNRLAIELQNVTCVPPRSGEREEKR